MLITIAVLGASAPALAQYQPPPQNEDGFRFHRQWRDGGALASTVNLLNEGSSFETGEAGVGLLDGVLYKQRHFRDNVIDQGQLGDANFDLAFDSTPANRFHGSRSLKIAFDGPWYAQGSPTGGVDLSWEWFEVPATGRYDISFHAKTDNTGQPFHVHVNLLGLDADSPEDGFYWVDLGAEIGQNHTHATLSVAGDGSWHRATIRTPVVSSARRYVLQIWAGTASCPQWGAPAGRTLWLDAVQVSAPLLGGAAAAFDYHTHAEELFLSVRHSEELAPRWNNVLYAPNETDCIKGKIETYQHPAYALRGSGAAYWTLLDMFPAGGGDPAQIATGSVRVSFAPTGRHFADVNLAPFVAGRMGTYKWIVDYVGRDGRRADRQELTFALVREAVERPAGEGMFGVNLNIVGVTSSQQDCPSPQFSLVGRPTANQTFDLAAKLGFCDDRVFGAYDFGCTRWTQGVEEYNDFYAELAELHDIGVHPVVSTTPSWFSGSDMGPWIDFIGDMVGRYGPGKAHDPGVTRWNLFNERNQNYPQQSYPGKFTPAEYAPYLLAAADEIHGTTPPGEMLIAIHGLGMWDQEHNYVADLLDQDASGPRKVLEVLDGIGLNTYAKFDGAAGELMLPEGHTTHHPGIPQATWLIRATKYGVQMVDPTGTGAVHGFPITETGGNVGWLLSDRATVAKTPTGYEFVDDLSGSLNKAQTNAERLIRHQLLNLGEGAGPIYLFGAMPHPHCASEATYGLFHLDFSPTVALAAQSQLNAELGSATLVRMVPCGDLIDPNGKANRDSTVHVYLFEDASAGEFVIAGWTSEGTCPVRFSIDPSTYGVTARDFQGNNLSVSGSDFFTQEFTTAPRYIRVDDSITAVGLAQACDHRRPESESMSWCGWQLQGNIVTSCFAFDNPGDVDELRFYWRPALSSIWTMGAILPAWEDPSFDYEASFTSPAPGLYKTRLSAIELTTGDEVFSAEQSILVPEIGGKEASESEILLPKFADAVATSGPNPAGGVLRLAGTAAAAGQVTLSVFDVGGRCVRTLQRQLPAAGPFEFSWDGRDDRSHVAPAGVYYLEVRRDGHLLAKKPVTIVR